MARIERAERLFREVALRLEGAVEGFVREIVTELAELPGATPVDTGLARGNWRPSLNFPVQDPTSLPDPTGAAAAERIRSVARQYRIGDTVYVVNRVPYIGQLNAGSSPQALPGFVEAEVDEAVRRASERIASRGIL